jgi:integration host factor subunit beta
MIKSELVRRIKEQNLHLHLSDVERLVDAIFEEVSAALARGDRVEMRGFGVFAVKTRSARRGRNPRNGASVSVPEKRYPAFRTSKQMHARLNGTPGSDLHAAFHKLSGERRGGSPPRMVIDRD